MGADSDLGGSASTMGTLSGGGKERVLSVVLAEPQQRADELVCRDRKELEAGRDIGEDGRLVGDIGQIGTDEARRALCNHLQFNVAGHGGAAPAHAHAAHDHGAEEGGGEAEG